jgi:hypothetical protein
MRYGLSSPGRSKAPSAGSYSSEQAALLQGLPDAISDTIRDELQREFDEEYEPAEGAFDLPGEDKP